MQYNDFTEFHKAIDKIKPDYMVILDVIVTVVPRTVVDKDVEDYLLKQNRVVKDPSKITIHWCWVYNKKFPDPVIHYYIQDGVI